MTSRMAICMAIGARPVLLPGVKAERIADLRARAVALAKLPARPLPHRVAPDLRLDFRFAHPGIIVPRDVIGTHMFEAEPVIGVEFEPRFRRAEIAAGFASGVFAQARRRHGLGREDGVYRFTPHRPSMGGRLPRDKHSPRRMASRARDAEQDCAPSKRDPRRPVMDAVANSKPPACGFPRAGGFCRAKRWV